MATKKRAKVQAPVVAEVAPVIETTPAPVVEVAAAKPAKKERRPSVVARIKSLLAENPKMPTKAIEDQLRLENFEFQPSTPVTIRQDFLASWRLLQQHGRANGLDLS
jgi:hypothetical protein